MLNLTNDIEMGYG